MDLAALTDLEWLLRDGPANAGLDTERERALTLRVARERGVPAGELRARLDGDRSLRAALAIGWLDAARTRREDLPGMRIAHGLDVAGWILLALGLLLGGGAARTLLNYDGSTPVNVLWFVFVMCVVQIALLVAMLGFVVRARRQSTGGGVGALHRPIAALAARFLGARGHAIGDALRAMRTRRGLYADVERWTLFALAQRFGVAFNIGALIISVATIVFSDLVFSWSTTLDLSPGTVHAGVRAISLPWAWLPAAVPSLEVVTASQWARMPGQFVGGTDPQQAVQLAAGWWSFLVAGVVCWGLLPRVIALLLGGCRARRALAAAQFDHVGYQELFDRLLPPSIGWQGPRPTDVEGPPPRPGRGPSTEHAPHVAGAPTWLVVWGSLSRSRAVVQRQLARRFGAEVRATFAAGGADLDLDTQTARALGEAKASRVVFAAAAGQQPTAEVLGFLRAARAAVGGGKPLIIGLLDVHGDGTCEDASAEERAQWRRSLGALDDPHLWVETLEVTP